MASFDEVVPPGQAGKVIAAVRTDGLSGPVSKMVTVTTDDPARPTFPLTLRANIVASVDFIPVRSMFFTTGSEDAGRGRLIVRKSATEQGNLEVSALSANAPWIKVSARKVAAPEPAVPGMPPAQVGDWVIEAKAGEDPPGGQGVAEVRFKTGLPREPEITFPVTVRVIPPLQFTVPIVYLQSPGAPTQPVTGTVYLQVRKGLDTKDLAIAGMPAETFKVVAEPENPQRYKVNVTWLPVGEGTPREGAITAKLGAESTSVAVRVTVAPPVVSVPVGSPVAQPPGIKTQPPGPGGR